MIKLTLIRSAVGAFLLSSVSAALAVDAPAMLADPTQPPAAIVGPDGLATAGPGATGLTSVKVPKKGGRAAAIIDGQVVTVGEMVGAARLVRLTETEAVLEGPEGVERLYLTPNVEKKMNVTKSAARRQKDKP